MNCPGSDRCAIREHKDYRQCDMAGACLLAPVNPRHVRRSSSRAGLQRHAQGVAGTLLYLAVVGVTTAAVLGFVNWGGHP